MVKKTEWTRDRIITIYEGLVKGSTNRRIAGQIGVNEMVLGNFLRSDKRETIVLGLQKREEWRERVKWTRAQEKKPAESYRLAGEIEAYYGMTCEEISRNNMSIFYKGEIRLCEAGKYDKVHSTVKAVLNRYDLIPRNARNRHRKY